MIKKILGMRQGQLFAKKCHTKSKYLRNRLILNRLRGLQKKAKSDKKGQTLARSSKKKPCATVNSKVSCPHREVSMDTQMDLFCKLLLHPSLDVEAKLVAYRRIFHGAPLIRTLTTLYRCYL